MRQPFMARSPPVFAFLGQNVIPCHSVPDPTWREVSSFFFPLPNQHTYVPVLVFPITIQQSSAVLCLDTSSMVYSFSADGAMVGWFGVDFDLSLVNGYTGQATLVECDAVESLESRRPPGVRSSLRATGGFRRTSHVLALH